MRHILFLLILFATSTAFAQTLYGEETTTDGAIPASALTEKMKGRDSLEVKITGTVTGVCQNKGCWLMIDIGEGRMMRVRLKDHAFFVPKDISGKTVVLDGHAHISTTSVAQLRHYAEDAGWSQAEIESITEPETSLTYIARSVIVM